MSEQLKNIPPPEMEKKLWEYIDGNGLTTERSAIQQLIDSNFEWKNKYSELLEIHEMIQSSELEQPSMRFTRNVMEEIAKYHIAPATKTYINKKIIWSIGAFFILMIVGFIIYSFGQVDWTADNPTTDKYISFTNVNNKFDFTKIFNNTYVNVFMMLNVVLGLFLLDRYLAKKRQKSSEF